MKELVVEPRLVSLREAAIFLGISESAISKWIRQGRLSATRLGRAVRIDFRILERVAEEGLPPALRPKTYEG